MALRPGEDASRVSAAWKRIDERLAARDPKLLETLRPKPAPAVFKWMQPVPSAWFKGHDGQKPTARPFHDGYRLLSLAEAGSRRKRHRGSSYRPDWDDSWTIIGACDAQHLLCCDGAVYAVDVSKKDRYGKTRVARSLAEWLEGAEAALTGDGGAAGKRAGAGKPPGAGKRVAPPAASAPLEKAVAAIAAWIAANPDEGYGLAKAASPAALRKAEKAFGRPLPVRVRALASRHDGQPFKSEPVFGRFELLSIADAAKEYTLQLRVRKQTGDQGYWKDEWWPFGSDGAGNSVAVDAKTGAVVEALNDPYRRARAAASLDRWVAQRAQELLRGAFL